MKIAITADWHLRGKDLEQTRAQLRELTRTATHLGCDNLIVCGDIFDRAAVGDDHASTGAIAEVAIEAVAAFPQSLLIPGNHDSTGVGSADALHVFDEMPNVAVVRAPCRMFMSAEWNVPLTVIPWMWKGELPPLGTEFWDAALLVGHLRIGGALMGRTQNYEAKPGDWTISRLDLESVPHRHVALGDFHKRQDLTDGRGGYVGALRQCNFGEEGNPQGYEILDTETWEARWIELESYPKHHTIDVLGGGHIETPDPGTKTRVRYHEPPDPSAVRELEDAGVEVQQIVESVERERRAEIPEGVMNDKRALIRLWGEANSVSGEEVEKMIETYEEVGR